MKVSIILTDWPVFREIDLKKLKRTMAHPTVLDGRNFFDPDRMRELGFTYRSVGRP